MKSLQGKKLLVLGGVYQHCKLVEAAHELGVTVIVDDYLPPEQAPAKQIADGYYMHNITDYEEIAEMCRQEQVDGVISTSLDACQLPYQKLCEKLGMRQEGLFMEFISFVNDENGDPIYCSERLIRHDEDGTYDGTAFDIGTAGVYENIYNALTEGTALAVPPEHSAMVIEVIECAHAQNPLPVKYI